ncbi:hypothetical protein KSS87_016943, partial [Heliosperma pusillum]
PLSACSPTSFNLLLLATHLINLSRPVIFFPPITVSFPLVFVGSYIHFFGFFRWVGGYPADSYVFLHLLFYEVLFLA